MKSETPMKWALEQAEKAFNANEVPIGAVIVNSTDGSLVAAAHNLVETTHNVSAHAELLALNKAHQVLQQKYLNQCDIYVTLEPCPMCAHALSMAKIRRIYFGAYDPKGGGIDHGPKLYQTSSCHHRPDVYGGIDEESCKALLKQFFKDKR